MYICTNYVAASGGKWLINDDDMNYTLPVCWFMCISDHWHVDIVEQHQRDER